LVKPLDFRTRPGFHVYETEGAGSSVQFEEEQECHTSQYHKLRGGTRTQDDKGCNTSPTHYPASHEGCTQEPKLSCVQKAPIRTIEIQTEDYEVHFLPRHPVLLDDKNAVDDEGEHDDHGKELCRPDVFPIGEVRESASAPSEGL